MKDRLLTVKDIMERYQCCRQTASRIIRSIPHLEDPHLMAYESFIKKWELKQMQG